MSLLNGSTFFKKISLYFALTHAIVTSVLLHIS